MSYVRYMPQFIREMPLQDHPVPCFVHLWRDKALCNDPAGNARFVRRERASILFLLSGRDGSSPAQYVAAGTDGVPQQHPSVLVRTLQKGQEIGRHCRDASEGTQLLHRRTLEQAATDATKSVAIFALSPNMPLRPKRVALAATAMPSPVHVGISRDIVAAENEPAKKQQRTEKADR